jgi:hypothetical protein
MNMPKPPPSADGGVHLVSCPRWGTKQAVRAHVGKHTSFIFYLCANRDCGGARHMWALDPSIRPQMLSTLAKQNIEEDQPEEGLEAKKKPPRKRGKK